jgi:hypothetical protein
MSQLASPTIAPLKEMHVFWRSDGEYSPSRISELSRTSAFIRTAQPASVGATLDLRLEVSGRKINPQGVVRRVIAGEGMGVEFLALSDEEREIIGALVQQIEIAEVLRVARASTPTPRPSALTPVASAASAQQTQPAGPPRNRPIDRRSRFRHRSTANVELLPSGAAESIQARLSDLGRGGCYVKLDEPLAIGTKLELSIVENGESFHARATIVSTQPGKGMGLTFTTIEANDRTVLDSWLATSMERSWLAANRRRSQRVMVSLPVRVAATTSYGDELSEETRTISVSKHGALLQLQMDVAKGQKILLRNPATNDELECSVDYLGSMREGRREVGVSFVIPNRTLWQIAFPPSDWSPQHPQAKS